MVEEEILDRLAQQILAAAVVQVLVQAVQESSLSLTQVVNEAQAEP